MNPDEARERLGKYVRARRHQLRLSIDEAAAMASMSPTTWSRIEKGKPVRDLSYSGVDRPLQWTAGSAEAIRAGGEPTPRVDRHVEAQDSARAADTATIEREPQTMEEVVAELRALREEVNALRERDRREDSSQQVQSDLDVG